jgi:hypothetical protein
MMKRYLLSCAIALALACSTLSAQTTATGKPIKMIKATSLTGCVERDASGAFTLGHITSKAKKSSAPEGAGDHAGMGGDQLHLMPSRVDFSTHVGHQVTVKGTQDGNTFKAKSITVLSTTCS